MDLLSFDSNFAWEKKTQNLQYMSLEISKFVDIIHLQVCKKVLAFIITDKCKLKTNEETRETPFIHIMSVDVVEFVH